jgi:hypothetical protein
LIAQKNPQVLLGIRSHQTVFIVLCFGAVALPALSACGLSQHPGYLSSSEACKGPDLSVSQTPAADPSDQLFVVTGVGSGQASSTTQACRLSGTVDLTIEDSSGVHPLSHVSASFDQVVGGGGELKLLFQWTNWCQPEPRASLSYKYRLENAASGWTRELQVVPSCRASNAPTRLAQR